MSQIFALLKLARPAGHVDSLSSQNVGSSELWRDAFHKPTTTIPNEPKSNFHTFNRTLHITAILSPFTFPTSCCHDTFAPT